MENNFVKYNSEYGIRKMIETNKYRLETLKLEREDIGQSWTPYHIECHQKLCDEKTIVLSNRIKELEEALQIKQS